MLTMFCNVTNESIFKFKRSQEREEIPFNKIDIVWNHLKSKGKYYLIYFIENIG